MRRAALLGIMLLMAGVGCAPVIPAPPPGPADPNAEMAPNLLVAPAEATPGEVIGLRFPEQTTRGIHFVLEAREGDSWQHVYDLISATDGGQPDWSRPGNDQFAIPDIGIVGPGPDRVQIPDDAAPGSYRICTGNAAENFCAPIEIVDS